MTTPADMGADAMKPPLPEPHSTVDIWGHDVNLYTASKVREYADTCTAALSARVAELEADAARYRWLRENCECLGWGNRSDAAIDAAMKEQA